jgi:hypothetical protein
MKEARSAIIIILVLLFLLVGIGVAISRVAKREKAAEVVKTEDQRGILDRLFLGAESTTATKTTKTSNNGKLIIKSESETVVEPTPASRTGKTIYAPSEKVVTTRQPGNIPATGTPSVVLITSLAGLASGFYIKKRS